MIAAEKVQEAHQRIAPYINETPVLSSSKLNDYLGHEIFFKVESFQKVGAFKARGALNALLSLKEQGQLPKEVVTFSSGNHAQAVAWASRELGIKATICVPKFISTIKLQATKSYGANVVICESRRLAEQEVQKYIEQGAYLLHPFDNDSVIAGQGTSCYEALATGLKPDAIFASCGGGGWLSGTYSAAKLLSPQSKVFGAEPLNANDAARSLREENIFEFEEAPQTIADGAQTLAITKRTLEYLKKLDGFYEIPEDKIIYWTQWLNHLLKASIEPTSAMAMAAAHEWLKTQNTKQKVLIMLSGGNISPDKHRLIWQENLLEQEPQL